MMSEPCVVVLDVGKTNIKIVAVDEQGAAMEVLSYPSEPVMTEFYLAKDIASIQAMVTEALSHLNKRHTIAALVTTAHGCGGVLVDDHGPVLPIMDYEATAPDWLAGAYDKIAPRYDEVFCTLSAGIMRPAQQMVWQSTAFPAEFAKARYFLTLPQYLAFWLGGRPASEISSFAAQNHLWNPLTQNYASIVGKMGWGHLFPPFVKAGMSLGTIAPWVAKATGLPESVEVLAGAHDSNANFFRYKAAGLQDHTVLSTGTWMIGFNRGRALNQFRADRAMVANVDVDGQPIASTLTMTGREYAILAGSSPISDTRALELVPVLLARGTLPLPSFADDDGPVPGSAGKGYILGPQPENMAERGAVAALYAAFTADLCLDVLGSTTPIVIDGGFATNQAFASLLSTLRPQQKIKVSRSKDGTALGAGLLWRRFERKAPVESVTLDDITPLAFTHDLREAAKRWRSLSHCDA